MKKGIDMKEMKHRVVRFVLGASMLTLMGLGSAFAGPILSLPPNPPGPYTANLTFKSDFSLGAYFISVFGTPTIGTGFNVVQGQSYLTWCVEFSDGILFAGGPVTYTVTGAGPYTFRNTLGTLPLDAQSANWGAVNWLLNNKGMFPTATVVDFQEAIWFLLNGAYHTNQFITVSVPSATTLSMVTMASAHNSFVPVAGQVIAVLADGGDGLTNNGSDPQSLIIEVTVPPQATGCPATQGFFHKANHWPTISGTVDGVTYNASTKMLTFGAGPSYTQKQILELLPSGSLHTGGVENDLSQFIAASLNLLADAQHTATIDGIVSTIAADLAGTNIFSPAVNLTAQAKADLAAYGSALDSYNSAVGLGCSEASGLSVGN